MRAAPGPDPQGCPSREAQPRTSGATGSDARSPGGERPGRRWPRVLWQALLLGLLLGLAIHQTLKTRLPSPPPLEPQVQAREEAPPTRSPDAPKASISPSPEPAVEAPPPASPEEPAERILLEYLEARPEDRERLRNRLLEAREFLYGPNPEGLDHISFQRVLYLTFLTEELGEGDHPKQKLDPGEAVCYDYVFANPRQSAAEFLRLRMKHRFSWELFAQIGGGPASRFRTGNTPFNVFLLDHLGPLEGRRVLELGGGLGLLAWEAARRVGPNGKVYLVEVDPSLGDFVEYTKTREEYRDLAPRLEFRLAVAPEDPGTPQVDVVIMQEVHLLCNDRIEWFRQKMLPNLVRSLSPGGRLAIQEGFRPDADPEKMLEVLSAAGFRSVGVETLPNGAGFLMVVERP